MPSRPNAKRGHMDKPSAPSYSSDPCAPGNTPQLLLHFGGCGGGGAHSQDLDHTVFILGAVIMNAFCIVGDEAADRDGGSAGRVVFGARAHPPGSRQNGNEAVV